MGYNLPDDWGSYYRKCYTCGYKYHLSGVEQCACADEPINDPLDAAECSCAAADWDCDNYDKARCKKCGSGPYRETVHKVTYPKARRRYHLTRDLVIEEGEKHKCVFTRGYYPDGPTLKSTVRSKLSAKTPVLA